MTKPTQAHVRKLLHYDPATGALTWKPRPREMFATLRAFAIWNKRFAGKPAFICETPGNTNKRYGNILIGTLNGKAYRAHRLIYFWMTGRWPIEIDHLDGNPLNNKWANLANTNRIGNQRNARRMLTRNGKPLMFKHAGIEPVGKRFGAYINVDGKRIRRGPFDTIEEAIEARQAMERKYGFSVRHGR
jgi:hypothetical protein